VYRKWTDQDNLNDYQLGDRVSSVGWHSDVTYEKNPPGLTALFLYDSPVSGGDTAYVDQRAAYNRLSPSFRAYLETLSVVHSGHEQANYSRTRGEKNTDAKVYAHVRREPVKNVHPLVRRHPVTGEKALFINRVFSRQIVGLKLEESAALLEFLYQVIERGQDFQVRLRWRPRTVVLWDNRITAHSALVDFDGVPGSRRHGARITPQAEVPTL
jgi:sulfonate dioxygenase